MRQQFFIADWHYGHKNIIDHDKRPFRDINEMNATLIRRWNDAVASGDTVYVIGDMFWCKSDEAVPILDSLHGMKILSWSDDPIYGLYATHLGRNFRKGEVWRRITWPVKSITTGLKH